MEKDSIITLEAVGEFPFTFYIEKAVPTETKEGELILEGIASTTNIDHDNERMSHDALRAMESAINRDGVPLRVEHQKDDAAIIGKVFKAWVDDRNQLHIRAMLNKSHPVSPVLHHSMKNGVKMGLSVGGIVKRAMREFAESVGGLVKTFYDVDLQEVSVTPRPANYDSWLVAKSIATDMNDAEKYSEHSSLRREFLFENSQLDYLQAFAKSVPDKAWRKVETSTLHKDNNSMETTDEKETKKADEKDEETTKAVSRSEFNNLSKTVQDLVGAVSKGFDNVVSMFKAMDGEPKDAVNPDKDKPQDESGTAKMGDGPKDQAQPQKDKPKDESPAAKSETNGTDVNGTREKTSDKKDETEKKEDDTYDVETLNRSIKTMQDLTKRLTLKTETDEKTKEKSETDEKETKEKAEKPDSEEETTKAHPLDVFVVSMTKAMEAVVDRMEKSGKRVLGFEKTFLSDLQNSPEVQAELKKLMAVPGFKKSVSLGVPYYIDKDGKRTPLIPQADSVEKSKADKPVGDFKTLYKTSLSSVSQETNG